MNEDITPCGFCPIVFFSRKSSFFYFVFRRFDFDLFLVFEIENRPVYFHIIFGLQKCLKFTDDRQVRLLDVVDGTEPQMWPTNSIDLILSIKPTPAERKLERKSYDNWLSHHYNIVLFTTKTWSFFQITEYLIFNAEADISIVYIDR